MRRVQTQEISTWGSLSVPSVLAAAHELKAPLVLLRQLSLQLGSTSELNPEQRQLQQRLQLTAERALRLVENITRSSRLDDAMFALEPLQAHAVWHGVSAEIGPLAQQMNQKLTMRVPSRPLLVVAHKELLPAILLGLCDNAIAHNPAGSPILLSVKRRGDAVVFSVRDQGPVIDAKIFRELEQRLGRAVQPLGVRPGSSGLGLWIAGAFAKAMNSRLSVTRHRSGGMTFSLHVPISGQLSLL
jgi:signal transduction histidine kinase